MMRRNLSIAASIVAMFALTNLVRAEDVPVTVKGTMCCAKCDLKIADKCQSVLQVKDGDKTTLFYIEANDVSKGTHEKVCTAPVEDVTITGTVADRDGKKWITPTKIEGLTK
jgi:hypothetical protein